MNYRVTYAIDSLDPNPIVQEFETECEAVEFLSEEVNRRVEFIVAHTPYAIDESEFDAIVETEYNLARIDRL
jgi:hypothetical protein